MFLVLFQALSISRVFRSSCSDFIGFSKDLALTPSISGSSLLDYFTFTTRFYFSFGFVFVAIVFVVRVILCLFLEETKA